MCGSINTYALLHKEHKGQGKWKSRLDSDLGLTDSGAGLVCSAYDSPAPQRRSLPLPLAFLSLSLFQVTSHRSPSFSVIALCQPLTLPSRLPFRFIIDIYLTLPYLLPPHLAWRSVERLPSVRLPCLPLVRIPHSIPRQHGPGPTRVCERVDPKSAESDHHPSYRAHEA